MKLLPIPMLAVTAALMSASPMAIAQDAVDLEGYRLIADRRTPYVAHVGEQRPELASIDAGRSDGVPLNVAMQLLAPPGWRVLIADEGVDQDASVRWTPRSTWLTALEQIGKQQGIAFTVHWQRQMVAAEVLPEVARQSSAREIAAAQSEAAAVVEESRRAQEELTMARQQILDMQTQMASMQTAMVEIQARSEEAGNPDELRAEVESWANAYKLLDLQHEAAKEQLARMNAATGGVESAPLTDHAAATAPQPIDPAVAVAVQEGERQYQSLNGFLQEQIAVDVAGVGFVDAVQAALPKGWAVDTRLPSNTIDNVVVDMTAVDARGAILTAVAARHGVSIIPFIEFRKVIVTGKE